MLGNLFVLCLLRTMRRPVPLEHCLYYGGELYKICEQSTFLPEGVKEAHKAHHAKTTKLSTGSGGAGGGQGRGGSGQGRGGGGGISGRGAGAQGRGGDNQGRGGGRKGPTSKQVAQGTIQTAMRGGGSGWRSETSQWYTLVNNLNKKGLLPVCPNLPLLYLYLGIDVYLLGHFVCSLLYKLVWDMYMQSEQ